jgi:hypothetical protein
MMMGGPGLGASRSPKENKREREREVPAPRLRIVPSLARSIPSKEETGEGKKGEKRPTRAAVRNKIALSV